MSFLAPMMLVAGALAAVAVLALHFLKTHRPPVRPLPTARFVPEAEARAVSRASRPVDLLLLALRMLAVLAVGAAFAGPVPDAPGPRVRTVVALEWSRALAAPEEARAAARALLQPGDALVVFDTLAAVAPFDSLDALPEPGAPARLSPAIVAARDAAARIARGADSVRLVVVAAVDSNSLDAATAALVAGWPGRVELRRLPARVDTMQASGVEIVGAGPDDPLAAAIAGGVGQRGRHVVRVIRRAATTADSAWLAARASAVLLEWPHEEGAEVVANGVLDVVTGATLVAPLARAPVGGGRVLARWRDGAPAAVERRVDPASGADGRCVRQVGVVLPTAGDLTLRAPFRAFLSAMLEPCAGARVGAVPDSSVPWLAADARPLATGRALAAAAGAVTPLAAWLLAAALALLAAEQLLRARSHRLEES